MKTSVYLSCIVVFGFINHKVKLSDQQGLFFSGIALMIAGIICLMIGE